MEKTSRLGLAAAVTLAAILALGARVGLDGRRDQGAPPRRPAAIIGGEDAPSTEFPWMVSLFEGAGPHNGGHFCGGSLITPNAVLTAAHCLDDPVREVVIGAYDLRFHHTDGGRAWTPERRSVAAAVIHPQYDKQTEFNDVAVLYLATPSTLPTLRIGEVSPAVGTNVTVIGWGHDESIAGFAPFNASNAPDGTTYHGSGRGWCSSPLNDCDAVASDPADCWELCSDKFGEELVAIDFLPISGANCCCARRCRLSVGYPSHSAFFHTGQNACECLEDSISDELQLVTVDSATLPEECVGDDDDDEPLTDDGRGTTSWGSGVGWCYPSFGNSVGVAAGNDCWELCASVFGASLVAVDWTGASDCYCQTDCQCMMDVGISDTNLITVDSIVALPDACSDGVDDGQDPEDDNDYAYSTDDKLNDDDVTPDILQLVDVTVRHPKECVLEYLPGFDICAGDPPARDACYGDSGGPLLVREGDSWAQVGVVSRGEGCAAFPGLYADATALRGWILTTEAEFSSELPTVTPTSRPTPLTSSTPTTPAPSASTIESDGVLGLRLAWAAAAFAAFA